LPLQNIHLCDLNLLGLTLSCLARAIPTRMECLFPMYTVWFSSIPLYHLPANTPGIKTPCNQPQSFSLSLTYHREKRKRNWGPYWGGILSLVPFSPKVITRAEVASVLHILWHHVLSTRIGWTHAFSRSVRLTSIQNKNISINFTLFEITILYLRQYKRFCTVCGIIKSWILERFLRPRSAVSRLIRAALASVHIGRVDKFMTVMNKVNITVISQACFFLLFVF